MVNHYVSYLVFFLGICGLPLVASAQPRSPLDSAYRANPNARQLDSLARTQQLADEQRTRDPALGRVPTERLEAAAAQLASGKPGGSSSAGIPNLTWSEQGPYGIGSQILTQLADPNDSARKKVWAGSQYGGLWFTTDITDANTGWRTVSDDWGNRNVSALAADPSNPQVLYAGTGEMVFNYYARTGGGIWKTTNGGTSWQRLSSTIPAPGNPLQESFYGISKLSVNAAGQLFAATIKGIIRSTDGGNSWAFVLAPQQRIGGSPVSGGDDGMSDLEMGSDGLLYAATRTGRLFRAATTAATTWTEITPPNTAPYDNLRTELVLAPATSGAGQVVYATGIFDNRVNHNKDVKWFLRSTDAGTTWAPMVRPVLGGQNPENFDFTAGMGVISLFMAVHPTDANDLYLGGYYYLYHSVDGGQTWGRFNFDRSTTFAIGAQGASWYSGYYGMMQAPLPLVPSSYYTVANQRNKRLGGIQVNSTAMRPVAGSPSFLALVINDRGVYDQSQIEVGQNPYVGWVTGQHVFNDQDEPGIQLGVSYYGVVNYRNQARSTNTSMTSVSLPGNSFVYNTACDYESRTNTLYTWNYNYYKVTDVGGQNNVLLWNAVTLGQPSCMRVGAEDNTLYVAVMPYSTNSSAPQLYRITNAASASPSVSRIDGGAFPAGTTISHIEVGRTDKQLLVTLSNYGVPSVWYTSNVGASWQSKDLPAHGLPDVPVNGAIFNPADNRQVMLATHLGVWTTTDITADNPGWQPGNTGLPIIRVNQLRVRSSDGRVLASTYGRGVWETSAWAVPNTPPQVTVGPLSTTALCAGNTLTITFSVSNATSQQFVVRLSDANGSFADNRIIGSPTSSPFTATIPFYSLPYGTGHRIRVEAVDLGISGVSAEAIVISDLNQYRGKISDRRNFYDSYSRNSIYFYGSICPGSTMVLSATDRYSQSFRPSVTVQWAMNGAIMTGQTSTTLPVTAAGIYSFTATEAGCSISNQSSYEVAVTSNLSGYVINDYTYSGPYCAGTAAVVGTSTLGEPAAYQWYRDGTAITGATSLTYAVKESGDYAFNVQEGSCSTSRGGPVGYTFSNAIYETGIYSTAGPAPTLCGGTSVYVNVPDRRDTGDNYQWVKDNVPLADGTQPYLWISEPGTYTVRIQRGNCVFVADPIVVVRAAGQPTNTIRHWGSTTVCAGTSKQLESTVSNTSIQWMKDGVDIPGATNRYYYATTTGNYAVRSISGSCSTTAPAVNLTFANQMAAELTVSNYCTGVSLSETNSPALSPKRYEWYKDGVPFQTTTAGYLYTTQLGTYSFSATYGSSCMGRSGTYRFVPGMGEKPVISAVGATQRCAGSAAKLIRESGAFTYWQLNGTRIPYSYSDYYYPTQSGRYRAVYDQYGCYAESNPIDVVIGEPVRGQLTGNAVVQAGQSGTLSVGFTGAAPWSLALSTGQVIGGISQNPYRLTLAPAATTNYTLTDVRNHCGTGQASGSARIVIGSGLADLTLRSVVSTRTPALGDIVSFSFVISNAGPQDAVGVQLTDRLPAGLTYIDGSADWQVAGSNLTLSLDRVSNGDRRVVSFRARVDAEGVYINAAEISDSQTPDPDSQPGSGTGDGQDDAEQVDFRTANASGAPVVSPNPSQQLLPMVQSSQPTPAADQADLSLQLTSSTRLGKAKETVMLTARVSNEGGRSATGIRVDVLIPNGSYLNASNNWVLLSAPTVVPYYLNTLAAGNTATVLIAWRPTGTGQVLAEIGNSDVPDPDSTPGNRATRPGEDDEANTTILIP